GDDSRHAGRNVPFRNKHPDRKIVNPSGKSGAEARSWCLGRGNARRCRRRRRARTQESKRMTPQHPTIGSLLRSLRARNGWTLKEMSERCGIPLSTLSKVEHDRLTLTYDKLLQISQRLNIRMSELFAEPDGDAEPAVTARRSIGRIEYSIRVNTPNYDYYYLCPELRRKRMIPVLTRTRAKSLDEFGKLVHHSGEEYIHVLEGRLEV